MSIKFGMRYASMVMIYTLIVFSVVLFLVSLYKVQNFGSSQIDELIFYFSNGIGDGQTSTFTNAVWQNITYVVLFSILLIFPIADSWRRFVIARVPNFLGRNKLQHQLNEIPPLFKKLYAGAVFTAAMVCVTISFSIVSYAKSLIQTTSFYEDNYVNPATTQVTFPGKKRNLVYIYLESMENTVASQQHGGRMSQSAIPELEKIALDRNNVSFSHQSTDILGGAMQAHGTSWTVAGITAQTGGVPLKNNILGSVDGNYMGNFDKFLPGSYMLGDILKREGYNQTFILGSKSSFGGRDKLFSQHGEYKIYDYDYAKSVGKFPSEYMTWWGYEDKKLFEYAKEELMDLSKQNKPFNFQLLTADTHFMDGFKDETCPEEFNRQYDNVHACSSKMVANFINWIKRQDFYKDTTIVISGDHLGMQDTYYSDLISNQNYTRTIYNAFINPVKYPEKQFNRQFTSFDMYPSTLSAMGANIEGDRLALGTDLFSSKKTLLEEMGDIEQFNSELKKRSKFYEKTIMRGQ